MMADDDEVTGEIDEFAMFQARALGAESEYLLLKQASRQHQQQGTAMQPRSSLRPGTISWLYLIHIFVYKTLTKRNEKDKKK